MSSQKAQCLMESAMYLTEIKSFADIDVQILPCTFQNEMPGCFLWYVITQSLITPHKLPSSWSSQMMSHLHNLSKGGAKWSGQPKSNTYSKINKLWGYWINLNFTQKRVKFSPKIVLDDASSKISNIISDITYYFSFCCAISYWCVILPSTINMPCTAKTLFAVWSVDFFVQ